MGLLMRLPFIPKPKTVIRGGSVDYTTISDVRLNEIYKLLDSEANIISQTGAVCNDKDFWYRLNKIAIERRKRLDRRD